MNPDNQPQVWIDLDGVLADLAHHIERHFGWLPDITRSSEKEGVASNKIDWDAVDRIPGFWAELPLMPDGLALWNGAMAICAEHRLPPPGIITGIRVGIPACGADKISWVRHHISQRCRIITCAPELKSFWCNPGDIIIDDYPKYRSLWVSKGGFWILHTNAAASLAALTHLVESRTP